jgi:hypothetical protein
MRELLKQILIIAIIPLLAGCAKDIDVFNPVPANSGDINLFFQEVKAEPKLYAWDASEELVVQLPSKGIMTIPANAFVYGENGQSVTGMVQTNITEIIEKQNLLGNRQNTSSEGMLMDAITTLNIEVFQNDLPIYLAEGVAIQVQVVGENHSAQLRLFSGDDSEGFIDWRETQKGDFPIRPTEIYDEEEKVYLEGIEFLTYDLGWIRCGRYLNEDFGMGDAAVCVTLPNGFSSKNTAAFLVFRNFDTVIPWMSSLHQAHQWLVAWISWPATGLML